MPKRIDFLTLFPEFFASPLGQSMLRRAQDLGAVSFRVIDLRDFATDRHRVADDRPFVGGPGMVMKVEPLVAAVRWVKEEDPEARVILLTPRGELFRQEKARELAGDAHLLLVCGHYEGVDDRVRHYVDLILTVVDTKFSRVEDWRGSRRPRFQSPLINSVHAVFPHTAFRLSSSGSFHTLRPRILGRYFIYV